MATADEIAFFQTLEDRLQQAYAANDVAALSALLASGWTMMEPSLGVVERDRFLQAMESGRLVHEAMRRTVLNVQRFQQIAIVSARGRNRGRYNHTPFDTEVWAQDVFQQQGDGWLCVASMEAPVVCNQPTAET